ncbi:MAG: hypothetical protein Q8O67_23015 [Deltaproteobacteria bacterium]|nr:hypothetical protein [Deltaproteobacteria bacterium]
MMLPRLSLCALAAVAGCAYLAPKSHFDNYMLKRAAFELDCNESALKTEDIGSMSIGVTGCDRRAVYQLVPNVGWVLASTDGAPLPEKKP